MNTKRVLALVLALMMTLTLFGCGEKPAEDGTDDAPKTVTITDMIGRQVEIVPGSYQRVVCIGAGALRLYSYVGDVSLLCGVEDIDNTTLEERPKMFDGVARPYVMVYGDTFAALPSCGVGGPNAQAAEAEKILSCTPDIIVSEYEDTDKAEALQQQVGVPVITLRTGRGRRVQRGFQRLHHPAGSGVRQGDPRFGAAGLCQHGDRGHSGPDGGYRRGQQAGGVHLRGWATGAPPTT